MRGIQKERLAWSAALAALLLVGCSDDVVEAPADATTATTGGAAGVGGAGGADGTTSSSTTTGSGGDGGKELSLGPPECYSPSGYQICGGVNHCPYDEEICPICVTEWGAEEYDRKAWASEGKIAMCVNDAMMAFGDRIGEDYIHCGRCEDGLACFDLRDHGSAGTCVPFEFAVLVAESGGAERLRYADQSLWTGEPLPEPQTCPSIPGVPICGGACGGCPAGQICTGRSPLHPHGLCVPKFPDGFKLCHLDGYCEIDEGCFRWKVQPEAQELADKRGNCLPIELCKAAADKIPGGGICDGQ